MTAKVDGTVKLASIPDAIVTLSKEYEPEGTLQLCVGANDAADNSLAGQSAAFAVVAKARRTITSCQNIGFRYLRGKAGHVGEASHKIVEGEAVGRGGDMVGLLPALVEGQYGLLKATFPSPKTSVDFDFNYTPGQVPNHNAAGCRRHFQEVTHLANLERYIVAPLAAR